MENQSNNGALFLLVVPLSLAIFSYSKGYSVGKGALVTVLGSVAIGIVLGAGTVGYMTYKLVNKDYTK
jgi:putative effector of murein hydrolase LrgA (UPF0299 family)